MTHARVNKTVSKSTSSKDRRVARRLSVWNTRNNFGNKHVFLNRIEFCDHRVTVPETLQLGIVIGWNYPAENSWMSVVCHNSQFVFNKIRVDGSNRSRGCSRCDSPSTQVANGTGAGWVATASTCALHLHANAANLLPRTNISGDMS